MLKQSLKHSNLFLFEIKTIFDLEKQYAKCNMDPELGPGIEKKGPKWNTGSI